MTRNTLLFMEFLKDKCYNILKTHYSHKNIKKEEVFYYIEIYSLKDAEVLDDIVEKIYHHYFEYRMQEIQKEKSDKFPNLIAYTNEYGVNYFKEHLDEVPEECLIEFAYYIFWLLWYII